MNKKISIVGLTLAIILGLSGCGNAGSQQSSGSQSTPSVSDNKETSSTAGTTATEDFLKTITAETAEAKGVCGADLTWYYKDNVLVIKGTGDMTDWGTSPWKIYNDGELEDKISWVIIDEGCTSIGKHAFYGLSTLSKVYLPDTLKVIRDYAFGEDDNLKELTLPASVKEIERFTFYYLDNITLTFLGDAPEGFEVKSGASVTLTINYSGSGFETYIEKYPNINWVKQ